MNDKKLLRAIEGAIKGDYNSYVDLIQMKGKNILYIATKVMGNKADGEDGAQEAVILLRQHIRKLKSPESFEAWMYRVVFNVCMGAKRKMKKSAQNIELKPEEIGILEERGEFLPEEYVVSEEKRSLLLEAIDGLPENYRKCVLLYYYEEMSYSEIAEAMDTNVQNIANNLNRAKQKLKEELQGTAATESMPLPEQSKNEALLSAGAMSAPVITRALEIDEQILIGPEMVKRLNDAVAAGTTSGVVLGGLTLHGILSSIKPKVVVGAVAAALVLGVGAWALLGGNQPALFNEGNSGANNTSGGTAYEQPSGVAPSAVLGEAAAQELEDISRNTKESETWNDFARENSFYYAGHFLSGEYRYTVYRYENAANNTQLIAVERKNEAGNISISYSAEKDAAEVPEGTSIIAAYEAWK